MGKNAALLVVLIFLTATYIITPLPVQAEPRTIVVPDDYPTIAAAVGNATEGDTILVRKGTYDGPWNETLFINKTISLIGEDAATTKLIFHPAWVTQWIISSPVSGYIPSMQIDAKDVKLGGFTLLNDGWNIWISGDRAQVMGNIITTHVVMNGSYQTFAFNTITDSFYPNGTVKFHGYVDLYGNYGIAAANTLVNGSINAFGYYNSIFDNTGSGSIGVGGSGTPNLIYGNTLRNSGYIGIASVGTIVANNTVSGSIERAIGVDWGSSNIIAFNTITNSGGGLFEKDNSGENLFYANYVANSSWGAKIVGRESNTTLYHNNFVNNVQQVNCDANETVIINSELNFTRSLIHRGYFDNGSEGNYWSDYTDADADGDGIGDTPYVIDENRSDHYPLMAPFDVSSVTIQLPEWANVTLPSPLQTPSFPPAPSPSPSPTPTPSPSPSPTPSPSPSPSPTATPSNTEPEPFPITLVATASGAFVAVAGIGLLVYFKKRKN
jgi:nitrous oxidase accessory protein NosD